jgi:uncharacterized protein YbcI
MDESDLTTAKQIAGAAAAFDQRTNGRLPSTVTVVLSEDAVIITLRGTFSPAETALAKSGESAAQLRELHRNLFSTACEPLRRQIRQITGVEVLEATAEVDTSTGTVVQVFGLAQAVPPDSWSGSGSDSMAEETELNRWDDDGGISQPGPEGH